MLPEKDAKDLAEAIWFSQLEHMTLDELQELGQWVAAEEGIDVVDEGNVQEISPHAED